MIKVFLLLVVLNRYSISQSGIQVTDSYTNIFYSPVEW